MWRFFFLATEMCIPRTLSACAFAVCSYYDFDPPEPFTDKDLRKIKKEMDKLIQLNIPFSEEVITRDEAERRAEMRATSPKYVPREWMLAAAYTKAEKGDFSVLHELLEVLTSPFDEHTPEIAAKYYRRPPTELEKKAGLAYFP